MSGVEAIAHALAGSTGGIVAMSLLYPLENIRTRLQIQVKRRQSVLVNPPVIPSPQPIALQHSCELGIEDVPDDFDKPAGSDSNEAEDGEGREEEEEECIAQEAQQQPSSSPKAEFFALQAAKLPPLSPPCLACLAESGLLTNTTSTISSSSSASSSSTTTIQQHNPHDHQYDFKGSWDVIQQVSAKEGWQKLYSGLTSALIGVGASSAVYFFWYYSIKSFVLAQTPNSKHMGPLTNLGVASLAGVINVFMTLPIWLVNTRLTVATKGEYHGVIDAVSKIHQEEGIKGFYRGLMPSLILVSNPAIQFVVYEQMIALWTKSAAKAVANGAATSPAAPIRLSSLQYFVLGAFAKAIATVLTYPYQVLKTRLQGSRTGHHASSGSTILKMWREEGLQAFYGGMGAKMTQTVLNSAFMFAVYERLVRIFLQFIKWLESGYGRLPKPTA